MKRICCFLLLLLLAGCHKPQHQPEGVGTETKAPTVALKTVALKITEVNKLLLDCTDFAPGRYPSAKKVSSTKWFIDFKS
jgi:hypothetical protein